MAFYTDGKFVYHSGDLVGIPAFDNRGIPVGYYITNTYGRYVYDPYGRPLFSPAIIHSSPYYPYQPYQPSYPMALRSMPPPPPPPPPSAFSKSHTTASSSSLPPFLNTESPKISKNLKNTKEFYDEIPLKLILFKWLSVITDTLYSEETKRLLNIDTTTININNKNSFLFFVKGGATSSLLLTHYKIKRVGIESDLDSTLLVNPNNKDFPKFINILTFQILSILKKLISDKRNWDTFNSLFEKYNLKRTTEETLIYNTKSGLLANYLKYSNSLVNFNTLLEPGYLIDCPLILEFNTNLTYAGKSFQIAKISLFTKTEPSLNLLDITIPVTDYNYYKFFWDTAGIVKYSGRHINPRGNVLNTHSFYVEDPISYIVDQLYTVKKDTWSNKNPKRLERVKTVKNLVKTVQERGQGNILRNRIRTFKNKNGHFPSEISYNNTLKNLEPKVIE
jgi:hypothetical protein